VFDAAFAALIGKVAEGGAGGWAAVIGLCLCWACLALVFYVLFYRGEVAAKKRRNQRRREQRARRRRSVEPAPSLPGGDDAESKPAAHKGVREVVAAVVESGVRHAESAADGLEHRAEAWGHRHHLDDVRVRREVSIAATSLVLLVTALIFVLYFVSLSDPNSVAFWIPAAGAPGSNATTTSPTSAAAGR